MKLRAHLQPLGLPLGWQLLGIIVGALIVAQLVTLILTILLPPAPSRRWDLEDVAASLTGKGDSSQLERTILAGPPDIAGGGWLVSESSRTALARKLNRPREDVILAFHTQLPVGGVTVPVNDAGRPFRRLSQKGEPINPFSLIVPAANAQQMPRGGAGGMPGGFPGGGFPGGRFPGGGFPGGRFPGPETTSRVPERTAPAPQRAPAPHDSSSRPASQSQPGDGNGQPSPRPMPAADGPPQIAPGGSSPQTVPRQQALPPIPVSLPRSQDLPSVSLPPITPSDPERQETASRTPLSGTPNEPAIAAARTHITAPLAIAVPVANVALTQGTDPTAEVRSDSTGQAAGTSAVPGAVAIPFRADRGLLSFTTPPFIEGDFIAAMRQADGRWIAVAPRAEPFPNSWQLRVMLWFALSLLIVAPITWAFARRIVKPLQQFAGTAEVLGRDPGAVVLPLSGPAEIGRAAHAFNQMQSRLRAFVDDRTAMVGAISHDLRTPLTRLRFRLEDVPDNQRDALLREVEEMELMITQVIGFLREGATPSARTRMDFAELVESTVEDVRITGGEVEVESLDHVAVDADPIGLRRLLANLLENAVKYGDQAKVRVIANREEAVAEIIDQGPGIPESEIAQAFDPFYRCENARDSDKPGSGLGLAVSRSIARAHGGNIVLEQRNEGFVARLSLPRSYDGAVTRAA